MSKYSKLSNIQLSSRQHDIIAGTLLGDGSLTKRYGTANCALRVGHSVKQKGYVDWMHQQFGMFSLPLKVEHRKPDSLVKTGCEMHIFRTMAHSEFTNLEKVWYLRDEEGKYILSDSGRRIKIIPSYLSLSFLSLSIWFFDDGTNLYRTSDKYPTRNLVLHSLGFSKDENDLLVSLVSAHGFSCGVRRNDPGWEIVIYSKSFFDFLDMVNETLDIPCMKYKCDMKKYKKPRIPNSKCDESKVYQIIKFRESGLKLSEIANLMNLSITTVSNVLTGKAWSSFTGLNYSRREVKGVYWNKNAKKWISWITRDGQKKYLGSFKDKTKAIEVRKEAEYEN